jgi:NAD(P)H-dependent flavin oxidoreductase YrpB (nitropropane dioxygenase family)
VGIDDFAIKRARAAGARVLVQVGDVETGERAAAAGADILIAQGVEAGGHVQSEAPLHRLVHDLREAVSLPILAAGGIAESASVVAALDAGAAGVVAGTAYLAADEADVHPMYRDQLFSARASATTLTTLFDFGWPDAPHRVLRNSNREGMAGCRLSTSWAATGRGSAGGHTIASHDRPLQRRATHERHQRRHRGDGAVRGNRRRHVQRQEAAAAITARLLTAASARNP